MELAQPNMGWNGQDGVGTSEYGTGTRILELARSDAALKQRKVDLAQRNLEVAQPNLDLAHRRWERHNRISRWNSRLGRWHERSARRNARLLRLQFLREQAEQFQPQFIAAEMVIAFCPRVNIAGGLGRNAEGVRKFQPGVARASALPRGSRPWIHANPERVAERHSKPH